MNFAHVRINNVVRQILFIVVLAVLGGLIFKELSFFLGGALGAITFYVILRKPYTLLVEKYHWNKSTVSLLLIFLLVIIMMMFGAATFEMIITRISNVDTTSLQKGLKIIGDKITDITGFQIHSSKILEQIKDAFLSQASDVLNSAYGFVANLAMMIFILYFMLVNHKKMEATIIQLIPFKGTTLQSLLQEIKGMIVSNAIGIPAIMIIQGIFASLGYWIFGIKDPFFWGVITGFFSIVPIIGTTAIWGVLSVYLFSIGQVWPGIGLLVYSAVVVGSMDNVVRIVLGKFMTDTHPLVTILGVIMGLKLFGFWGIIFGPLMINLFILLIRIYRREYLHEKEELNKT